LSYDVVPTEDLGSLKIKTNNENVGYATNTRYEGQMYSYNGPTFIQLIWSMFAEN